MKCYLLFLPRLVMYIERDCRRAAPQAAAAAGSSAAATGSDYLTRCLELLITTLASLLPDVSREMTLALASVAGRKHPSTLQVKQLKTSLPMMPVLQHFITSQVRDVSSSSMMPAFYYQTGA